MSCYFKFNEDDVFINQIKAHPSCVFYIYSGSIYYNNKYEIEETYSRPTLIDAAVTLPDSYTLELSGPIRVEDVGDAAITVGDDAMLTIYPDIPGPIKQVNNGNVSLYEMNIDRDESTSTNIKKLNPLGLDQVTDLIYPFVTKAGSFASFRTVTTKEFNEDFKYGDTLTGSYPMSASIVREFFTEGPASEPNPMEPTINPQITIKINDPVKVIDSEKTITDAPKLTKPHIIALKKTLNSYTHLSKHYEFSSSGNWDKGYQALNLISIPSIFYGSSIKKGSITLKYYITGTLIAEAADINKNGEIIQTKHDKYWIIII